MKKSLLPIALSILILSGCMSREEAAKHVTITLIQSPEAKLSEWRLIPNNSQIDPSNSIPATTRYESPLGTIEISQTPTRLKIITESQTISTLNTLKQHIEQQVTTSHGNFINPADDDSLQLAGNDFLHTTYRIRQSDNQRQRIELYVAPIHQHLVTIIARIGDDADMQSYSALQTFLNQRVEEYSHH
jgi:PBP1b-binding outer membrane lipoprotein LpoB